MPASSAGGPRASGAALLVAKLLALALVAEGAARVATRFEHPWYAAATRDPALAEVGFVFVGSSRVAAAVDPAELERAWRELGLPPRRALNMGRGFSTLAEAYFGLRALAAARPGGLDGVVVALEAAAGTPPRETWRDGWAHPEFPELLAQVVTPSDLPRLWRESSAPARVKWAVTVATFSHLARLAGAGKPVLGRVLAGPQVRTLLGGRDADLSSAGGVLAGEAFVAAARRSAVAFARADLSADLPPVDADDDLVLRSLADLVRGAGGRLVLYEMPLSSVQLEPHLTPAARRDRATLTALAAAWDAPVLSSAVATSDEDFPDLWHLRRSRAPEFTRGLAASLARWSRSAPERRGRAPAAAQQR